MEVRTVPFMDEDPLEQDMGVRCEDMTPNQLLKYVVTYQKAFGMVIKVEGARENGVFTAMQRIYGQRDAGLIVKWSFWKHRGRYRDEYVTPLSFATGRRWWLDKMHLEMQEAVRKSDPRHYQDVGLGGRGLLDL
jgi:hypothetical protein